MDSERPGAGLIERVKAILLSPKEEWARIDAEPATIAGIYKSWVLPLAAIPAVAGLIGSLVFGYSVLGVSWRPSITGAIGTAVVQYGLALVGVFVLALIIDALAPTFQATKNQVQAFKVAAYSMTASWVAGIFSLLPAIAFLGILGLYSLYLLYLGLPKLMKAPSDKAVPYSIATVVAGIVIALLIGALTAPIAGLFGAGAGIASRSGGDGEVSGTVTVPGVGSIDVGKLEQTARRLEQQQAAGPVAAIVPAQLQGLLPASAGGLTRTSIESSSASAGGLGGSRAEARYGEDGRQLTLQITDMAAAGGLAALGSALNVESSRQTESGYEIVRTVNGRLTKEEWDNNSQRGSYGVLVGERFMIEADGEGVDMDTLKSIVAGIDTASLERAAAQ